MKGDSILLVGGLASFGLHLFGAEDIYAVLPIAFALLIDFAGDAYRQGDVKRQIRKAYAIAFSAKK